jgi:CBS domain-containing protein
MKVEQIMSRPVLSCTDTDTLNRAAQVMWENDVGCVVVQANRKLVGIITDRDICMAAYTRGEPLSAIRVSEVMTRTVETVLASDRVETAERLMREKRIRRLPVIDASKALVGFVSLNDLALEAEQRHGRKAAEVTALDVTATLAEIGKPRQGRIVPTSAA